MCLACILVDVNGTESDCGKPVKGQCRFMPGSSVSLTVGEWLRIADRSLHEENMLVRANGWNNSNYDYPLHRITGVEVLVSTKYEDYNFHDVEHPVPEECGGDNGGKWPYTVCKVVVKGISTWTGMPTNRYAKLSDASNEDSGYKMRQRYYEGIRFVFTSSVASKFGYPSVTEIMDFIVNLIVYFGFVGMLVECLAIYGLGNTSRTYYRSQQEPLRVSELSSKGLPSRLLQSAVSFYMLSAVEQMADKGNEMIDTGFKHGFTYETLHKVFKHVMQAYEEIDAGELDYMARVVFNALSSDKQRITLADFCEATSSNESFDIISMAAAFDFDRKKCCLESLFKDGAGQHEDVDKSEHKKKRSTMATNPESATEEGRAKATDEEENVLG